MALLGDVGAPLMGLLVLVSGLFMAWFAGRSKGAAQAEVKAAERRTKDNDELAATVIAQNKAAAESEVEAVVKANVQIEDVNAMSDADVMRELREHWTAPANGKNGSRN